MSVVPPLLIAVLAAVLLTGCHHGETLFDGQPSNRVYTLRQVQQGPVLRGCAGYNDPNVVYAGQPIVRVRFVVRRDGAVDPSSAVVTSGTENRRSSADGEAVDAARSCVYDPALLKGAPVAVRTSKTFVLP